MKLHRVFIENWNLDLQNFDIFSHEQQQQQKNVIRFVMTEKSFFLILKKI